MGMIGNFRYTGINLSGRKTDHGETAAERVGREMVLPLPGGGHEGSRF